MKGLIKRTGPILGWFCTMATLAGCCGYRDLVDPCYPTRYMYMARKELQAGIVPQINNGHVLDQTIWNWHFECGTDHLTAAGLEHLAYIARRRPHPDTLVFLQTAQDIPYCPPDPSKMAEIRQDLDCKRIQAIQKFLTAQTTGQCMFRVEVHDPAEVGLNAIFANGAIQQLLLTRPRAGLIGSGGGTATPSGTGALPAGQ